MAFPPGTYDVVGGAAGHALVRVPDVELGANEVEVSLVLPGGGKDLGPGDRRAHRCPRVAGPRGGRALVGAGASVG